MEREGIQRRQVQSPGNAEGEQRLDLAREEQIPLGGPVRYVVEGVHAGKRTPVDQRAALRHPVEDGRLVVALHAVGRVGESNQAHARLHHAARLSAMLPKHLAHRQQRLVNRFLWYLLACEPSCKCWHRSSS